MRAATHHTNPTHLVFTSVAIDPSAASRPARGPLRDDPVRDTCPDCGAGRTLSGACVVDCPDTFGERLSSRPQSRDSGPVGCAKRQKRETMIPDFGPQADAAVAAAVASFPPSFGLRAYSGDTFRVSSSSSYVSGGRVVLYTERLGADGQWRDFAKGSADQLREQMIALDIGPRCGELTAVNGIWRKL